MSPCVVRRHKHGARDPPCAPLGEGHARGHTGIFGVRGDSRRRLAVAQHLCSGARPVERRGHQHGHAPGAHRRVHARLLRDALHAELVHPVDVHLAGLRAPRPPHRPTPRPGRRRAATSSTARTCNCGSGQRPFTDREDPRAALVGDPHQLSGGAPAGHPGEKIQPNWIFVRVHHPRRAGVRVAPPDTADCAGRAPVRAAAAHPPLTSAHAPDTGSAPGPRRPPCAPRPARSRTAAPPRWPCPPPGTRPGVARAPGGPDPRSTTAAPACRPPARPAAGPTRATTRSPASGPSPRPR